MQSYLPKTQIIIFTVIFVFSCLIFIYFSREIKSNEEKSQLAEIQLQTEKLRRNEIETLDHSIKIIENERMQLETHFAQSSDIVPFLDTIEELAPKVGARAEVTSVNISSDLSGLNVGMKASGTFNGLYKFLKLLENSPYELEFVSMNFQSRAQNENDGVGVSGWEGLFEIKLLSFVL